MSKKETEFDRYDRMKRMEKELEVQKKKDVDVPDFSDDLKTKKGGKVKPLVNNGRKKRSKEQEYNLDEEYDYV